tara:strand:+ start:334 stop:540 length:207 start_codon:yes stop_codon:yes gene_type:complete
MKTTLAIIGFIFIAIASLATPIAIGIGLYDWVGNDMQFKYALWEGFKVWAVMLVSGLAIGLPCFFAAQ